MCRHVAIVERVEQTASACSDRMASFRNKGLSSLGDSSFIGKMSHTVGKDFVECRLASLGSNRKLDFEIGSNGKIRPVPWNWQTLSRSAVKKTEADVKTSFAHLLSRRKYSATASRYFSGAVSGAPLLAAPPFGWPIRRLSSTSSRSRLVTAS